MMARMGKVRGGASVVALLVAASAAGCGDEPAVEAGLAARSEPVDTTRITGPFRGSGGNVFVTLTGRPGADAVAALVDAGLGAPLGGSAGPVVMAPLAPTTVWGWAAPESIRTVAALPFVTAIEPSVDSEGLGPR